jgi:hypothetical protein
MLCAVKDGKNRWVASAILLHLCAVLVTSSTTPWFKGGTTLPGRFLVVVAPLLVAPAALLANRSEAARGWLVFLGLTSSLTFALLLLNLSEVRRNFDLPDVSLQIVLPFLRNMLQPLHDPPAGQHVFALFLYLATMLLLALPPRRRVIHSLVLLLVCLFAVRAGRTSRREPVKPRADYNAAVLADLDLDRARMHLLGSERGRLPLFSVVDSFAGRDAARDYPAVTTDDLGTRMRDGVISRPHLEENDWDGRGYRWTTLVPPFKSRAGQRVFGLRGRLVGTATLILAIREGSRQILEEPVRPLPDGTVSFTRPLRCERRGDVYLLVRLADGRGTFTTEKVFWAPFSPNLARSANLHTPTFTPRPGSSPAGLAGQASAVGRSLSHGPERVPVNR